MQHIALSRMGTWVRDTWEDTTHGWTNYGGFGLLTVAILIGQVLLLQLAACCGARNTGVPALLSFVTTMLATAYWQMGLVGVATARLHGREGTEADFRQDLSVLGQTILADMTLGAILGLAALIASGPGLAFVIPGVMRNQSEAIVAGAVFCLLGVAIAACLVTTLTIFTVPLVVERRMDFWTALWQSIDCTRRDLLGLMLYLLLVHLLLGMVAMCTCYLLAPLALPLRQALVMRAYRDYFGLGVDHMAPMQVVGYSSYGNPSAEPWESGMGGRGYSANSAPIIEPPAFGYAPPAEPSQPPRPPSLPILPLPPLPEQKRCAHLDEHPYGLKDDDELPPPPPPA